MKSTVYLAPPPHTGIHTAIMSRAVKLWHSGFTLESATDALHSWRGAYSFRRPVTDRELVEAISKAYRQPQASFGAPRLPRSATDKQTAWPPPDPQKRARLVSEGFCLYDLWELSPWKPTDSAQYTHFLLERLFPGDPLLCIGHTMSHFDTRPLSQWSELQRAQFLVPSPMRAQRGMKRDGSGESAHTLDNTGPRRFLVVDFDDHHGLNTHAAAAWFLAEKLPLALVLHSGGKGLHAWFLAEGRSESELRAFFSLAVECGGDPVLWGRSQFVRMPDGRRENGVIQRAYYFNREVLS
jgi:hypothetical protein